MILVCGGALIDMVPTEEGGSVYYKPCAGGGVCNTAVAIGALGVDVSFFAKLSTDFFGEIIVERLRCNNIGIDYLKRSVQHSTLAFVKLDQGREPLYNFFSENSADRSLSANDIPSTIGKNVSCVVFGDIAMTMEPVATTIETLIEREHKNGKVVISFDPNIRPFLISDKDEFVKRFEKWLSFSTIAKISEADFDFLYPGLTTEECIKKTHDNGVMLAVVTLGDKGALASLKTKKGSFVVTQVNNRKIKVIDTIGAGDTFHGALLSYLEMNGKMSPSAIENLGSDDLQKALHFANTAASIVCTRQGAQPPSLKETQDLL